MNKPTLCLDFDGVIHRYDSGWQGPLTIADNVTDGFFEWLDEAAQHFRIVVYSTRSSEPGATDAMTMWLAQQRAMWRDRGGKSPIVDGTPVSVEFADKKPAAFLQIDDRAIQFDGDWGKLKPAELRNFKPWNKREVRETPSERSSASTERDEIVATLRAQHDAIDMLFALLVGATHRAGEPTFLPSKSPAWPAAEQGARMLEKLGAR